MATFSATPRAALLALTTGALAIALGLGYWLGRRGTSSTPTTAASISAPAPASAGSDVLYWYDPMKPDQHFNKPGKSPFMDMQLVPKRASAATTTGVQVSSGTRQSLGIRTALVEVGPDANAATIASGTLQWDLRGESRVSSRVEGYVDQVYVRAPFERVRAGQPLAAIIAPKLASALAEYHALASSSSNDARSVTAAARERLRVLGLGDSDTRASSGGVPHVVLRAPSDGVLAEINVRVGDNVTPGQPLFRLNATDPVWMEARVPQASATTVLPGAMVTVRVSSFPGQSFSGRVDSLLPQIDPQTRTQTLRIVLGNRDARLAAGMFAEAELPVAEAVRHPWVPSEALILTGTDARVIVEEDGAFVPVRVSTGQSASGRTEILQGLVGGERVVVSGQFLLDSEASLSGALQRLDGAHTAAGKPAPAPTGTPP